MPNLDIWDVLLRGFARPYVRSGPVELEVPDGICEIWEHAFMFCKEITGVSFPRSLTMIYREAFRDCTGLVRLEVPDNVKTIEKSAFEGCSGLREIRLPDALSGQVRHIFGADVERMFLDVRSGKLKVNPRLAAALTSAMRRSWDTHAIDLIYDEDCEGMEQYLALWDKGPVPIRRLDDAIELSREENRMEVAAMLMDYKNRHYPPAKLEAMRLREAERALRFRERTLTDWRKLFSYEIWKGKASITQYRGYEKWIEVPATLEGVPVTAIKNWKRRRQYKARPEPESYRVILPEGLREICDKAFESCKSLTEIVIPSTVDVIGERAFQCCTSLKRIAIPEGVSVLHGSTFLCCTALTSVHIPESLTTINWNAFDCCSNLQEVVLPPNVVSIYTNRGYEYKVAAVVPKGSQTEQTIRNTQIPYRVE